MSTTRHRTGSMWRASVAGGLLLVPLLFGCQGAVVGNWYLAEAIPNREVFSIDQASFRRDGTFTATTTIEGLTSDEQGTYSFNGWELKLRPKAGGQRTYPAMLQADKLVISNGQRKAILKKGKRGT